MDIKLNRKDGFWLSNKRKGVYQYRENPCITYSLYQYKQSSTKEEKAQLHKFYKRKLSRKFIADIDVYSNNQSCGLYNYCALLCWALSYSNTTQDKPFAWISRKIGFYMNLFGCKTKSDCIATLQQLYDYGLICFKYEKEKQKIDVFITAGETTECKTQNKKAEYAVINNKAGFVFVPDLNIEIIRDNAKSYSERDILVDIWLNVLYQDTDISLSKCPIAVFDRYYMNPLITYKDLARRYHCSVGRMHQFIKKIINSGLCNVYSIHKHGACIFMPLYTNYLFDTKTPVPSYFEVLSSVVSYKTAIQICWTSLIKKINTVKENLGIKEFIKKFKRPSFLKFWIHFRYTNKKIDYTPQVRPAVKYLYFNYMKRCYFSNIN